MTIAEHLLETGVIDGSALIDGTGRCLYSCGSLQMSGNQNGNNNEELFGTNSQFLGLFVSDDEKSRKSFVLFGMKFLVFQKTHCSIYAISKRKSHGMIINNLPFSIM